MHKNCSNGLLSCNTVAKLIGEFCIFAVHEKTRYFVPERVERAAGGGAGEDGRDNGNPGHVVGDLEAIGHGRDPGILGGFGKGSWNLFTSLLMVLFLKNLFDAFVVIIFSL